MKKRILLTLTALTLSMLACQALFPKDATQASQADATEDVHTGESSVENQSDNGFPDRDALPNDSGIEGVQTFPDKSVYHNHAPQVTDPAGDLPPSFGEHLSAWQNCGIYDQPIEVGHALHSLEHGAVWLTYSPDVTEGETADLRAIVRNNSHGFVLMSPYDSQKAPVVLSAWTVQLVIESLPDERIEKFIQYYENGPQNPEPGAPCSGKVGEPLP